MIFINLFELFVKIGVDDQASGEISTLSQKLGNGLKAAAAIGTAAVTAAGAAFTATTAAAVKSYAEYEQLVGGAQLLFGSAYDSVSKKSAEAYKTVQISQSQYLQQVNGFATGLKTALGGNARAAAELADKIIIAQADVVAATGASQEAVQSAFSGIMRSNFTMLDNLQLGITPTKEGFQSLIDKVNEWNTANGEMTNYQMGNLADMQSALIDYIEMQGLAGYATNEGANTISGSVATMKAAWENLVTGVATSNAEIDVLLSNFLTSVQNVAANIAPVVARVIDNILTLLINNGPAMIAQGGEQLNKFIVGLTAKMPEVIKFILDMVIAMGKALIDSLPYIIALGLSFLASIRSAMIEKAAEIGSSIVDGIKSGIQNAWNGLVAWFNGIWDSLFSNRQIDVSAGGSTYSVNGSHANGLDYVPFNGYIAELHKGERVLTAEENKNYNAGKTVSIVQNIYSQAKTAADLMEEALYKQEEAVLLGV